MMSGLLTAGFSQSSVNFQNYYVNISRPNGGAANNGDTLEIRGVINVLNGTNFTRVRFLGVVPTGTTYIPGSLQAKTNEGVSTVTNTGSYTDAAGDDMAQISGSNVTINLGQSAGVPPAKLQVQDVGVLIEVSVNWTDRGARPFNGVAVKSATGAGAWGV